MFHEALLRINDCDQSARPLTLNDGRSLRRARAAVMISRARHFLLNFTSPKVMKTYVASAGPRYAPCSPHNFTAKAAIAHASSSVPFHFDFVSRSILCSSPYFRTFGAFAFIFSSIEGLAHAHSQVLSLLL